MKWSEFQKPLMCLAPMDGITNTAYRQIVRKIHSEVILFSEFTNVDGILRSEHVRKRLDYHPSEHPFFMQVFGNDPKSFAEVSKMVEDRGIMGVDINMGCPAKKIVHSQHGSALMKEPELACRIIDAIRKACNLEVSVKTRLGWENHHDLIRFGKRLESAGVSLLTIHGRTYKQAFRGEANWGPIYELKEELKIPVVGNGDVADYADGVRRTKNLDGFMIGRSAIGNPWAFVDFSKQLRPDLAERVRVALEHYELLREIKPERTALLEFRKYLGEYIQGFHRAKEWRAKLMQCSDEKAFIELLQVIQESNFELPLAEAC